MRTWRSRAKVKVNTTFLVGERYGRLSTPCRRAILFVGSAHDDPERVILFQFFHLCRQIGISAYSVGGILARQNPDIVIRL